MSDKGDEKKPASVVNVTLPPGFRPSFVMARCPRCAGPLVLRGQRATCGHCDVKPPTKEQLLYIAGALELEAIDAWETVSHIPIDHPLHAPMVAQTDAREAVAAWLRVQVGE